MVDLIAFGGFAGAGKDCAAQVLLDRGWHLVKFADPMRLMLEALDLEVVYRGCSIKLNSVIRDIGFDASKREIPYVRHVMQRLGTEAGRGVLGDDVWVDYARNRIADLLYTGKKAVVTDVRFENEVDLIRDFGGLVVRIDRPGVGGSDHASEQGIASPDRIVMNDGTVEALHEAVVALASTP